jgi:hypothetical protein
MKAREKGNNDTKRQPKEQKSSLRNRPLHIPLDFEKAVEGLLNVKPKPKKKQPKK